MDYIPVLRPTLPETAKLLVIGLEQGSLSGGTAKPVPYVPLAALDAKALHQAAPDLVICALFAADLAAGDAFALIERLESLRYRGRILVICPSLPCPDMIEAELQALGPGPRLTLIARA